MSDRYKEQIDQIDITLPAPEREPERQFYFIKKCQGLITEWAERKGRPITCRAVSFG